MQNQEIQQNSNPPSVSTQNPVKFGLSITIIVICLISAAVAVYWIETEPVDLFSKNLVMKRSADSIDGWQTFENEKYGYRFQFPANDFINGEPEVVSVDEMINTLVYAEHSFSVTNISLALEKGIEGDSADWLKKIYSLPTPDIANEIYRLNKEYKSERLYIKVGDLEEILFAGKKAYRFNIENGFLDGWGIELLDSPIQVIFVGNGINKFQITYPLNNPIAQRIADSFEFIEPTDTTGWQTYRNEEYGFEIKYPSGWEKDIGYQEPEKVVFSYGQFFGDVREIYAELIISSRKMTSDFIELWNKNLKPESETLQNIGGAKALVEETLISKDQLFNQKSYAFTKGMIYYSIQVRIWDKNKLINHPSIDYGKIFDQILFTFKFIK